jgi:hypothetical protein
MKPITWLRKSSKRAHRGYPVAVLMFYGPDNKKASKAVLSIIVTPNSEPVLHKWFRELPNADLRYGIKLQNTWIEIIRQEGVRTVMMVEEINGCPHEEGVDYPVGEVCPECPYWANRRRPFEPPADFLESHADSLALPEQSAAAIATYRKDQWEMLRATAADRDNLEETWEEWNTGLEKLVAKLEAGGILYVRVLLDVEEIQRFCQEQGIPNDSTARSKLALSKAKEDAS